ncbi:MAG TPA: hypothetical protein VKY22_22945 [Bradyrhizobium sp.]|jgi:hypothetical protein|nr:hypothetical protein [Bradyrhizobium sp.]
MKFLASRAGDVAPLNGAMLTGLRRWKAPRCRATDQRSGGLFRGEAESDNHILKTKA